MLVAFEFDIHNFDAWSGGIYTKNKIIEAGLGDAFNRLIDEIFLGKEYITDTEMNDLLWFEADYIFQNLGLDENGDRIEEEEEEEEEEK